MTSFLIANAVYPPANTKYLNECMRDERLARYHERRN